jgi:hypothetical protein
MNAEGPTLGNICWSSAINVGAGRATCDPRRLSSEITAPTLATVTSCGHQCCEIAGNAYHSHTVEPATCPRCTDADAPDLIDLTAAEPRATGPSPSGAAGTGALPLSHADVSDIVTAVVDRVAPQIPGLPADREWLLDRVVTVTAGVHRQALTERELQQLSADRRRTILAARVGLALAFPGRFPWG